MNTIFSVLRNSIFAKIYATFIPIVTQPGDFHYLQNRLLEVGWNKSEATQRDVEKTLNCCGFSNINYNGSCAAVSKPSRIFSIYFSCQLNVDLHDHTYGSF